MLKIENFGQDYLVSFEGIEKININNAVLIKNKLLPIITASDNNINIDFEGVTFIDSSGFQVMIALLKAAELFKSKIELMNVSDDLRELFDLLNLSDVFQIAAN